jgi:Mg/Co/Ni transporter MgtE
VNDGEPLTLTLTPTQIHNTKGADKSAKGFGFFEILKIWNNMAQQVGIATSKENSKLFDAIMKNNKKALLSYPSQEDWQRIIEAIPLQNFRLGVNERGWKADFAWLFQNHGTKKIKNYILLMEEWENHNEAQND